MQKAIAFFISACAVYVAMLVLEKIIFTAMALLMFNPFM